MCTPKCATRAGLCEVLLTHGEKTKGTQGDWRCLCGDGLKGTACAPLIHVVSLTSLGPQQSWGVCVVVGFELRASHLLAKPSTT
jgi:hypothetical protein